MKEHSEHVESRLKKLRDLREAGVEPFAGAFESEDLAGALAERHAGASAEELSASPVRCSLAGRLVALRRFGKAAFAHLDDGTGRIQVYFKKDVLGEGYDVVNKLDMGDIVGVRGKLFRTKTGELTVEVEELKLLTKSIRPLPVKWHGMWEEELRYRQSYLDLIVNPLVKETFRKRSAIISAIRGFLESRGYIEVETPMMQRIPGGAAARPFRTHHNALDIDLYLRIAPELYLKRLLIGGYGRIYELNRNFRNEGISTKHNPEFSMLEFYTAYKDYNYLMDLTEELITQVCEKVLGTLHLRYGNWDIDFSAPWPRVSFLDALLDKGVPEETFADREKAVRWAEAEGIELPSGASQAKVLDEIFKDKVEPWLIQPTFITDYPVELSPLARRKPGAPGLVERFELFVATQEIANAFSELTDPMDQRERFLAQVEGDEEAHRMDEDFVTALEHGMPPAAGEGIGIDRLVMILTDSPSIRDVIFFPHLRPRSPGEEAPEGDEGGGQGA
ncbi:MAG: lysine--tRNA ligase [Nitrospirota bacterium]